MTRRIAPLALLTAALCFAFLPGCGGGDHDDADDHGADHDDGGDADAHDGDGDHGDADGHGGHPPHGRHHGHVFELEGLDFDIEYVEEKDPEKVVVYIVDESHEAMPIAADSRVSIVVTVAAGSGPPFSKTLTAAGAEGDPPMTARFESADSELRTNIQVATGGEGAGKAVVIVEHDGKTGRVEIQRIEH